MLHYKIPDQVFKLYQRLRKSRYQSYLLRLQSTVRKIGLIVDFFYLTRENEGSFDVALEKLPAGYTSSFLDPIDSQDLQALASLNNWTTLDQILDRIKSGQRCIVLRSDDQIVGYTWARFDRSDDPGCHYVLAENETFLQGAFIHPLHRNKSLATPMRAHVYRLLEEQGIRYFVSSTDVLNEPARKFKARLGAIHIERYVSIKWLGMSLLKLKKNLKECPTRAKF